MSDRMAMLREIVNRHSDRMLNDPRYRYECERMQFELKNAERNRLESHYDRDGYCDNPARGF